MIVVVLIVFGYLIYQDTKRVDKYWECQTEISSSDSINMLVSETKNLRGFLSFNRKVYLSGAKLFRPDIELWEVPSLELPFTIKKNRDSDTIYVLEYGFYFVFKKQGNSAE